MKISVLDYEVWYGDVNVIRILVQNDKNHGGYYEKYKIWTIVFCTNCNTIAVLGFASR